MHLYNNMWHMFGKGIKNIVWAAAAATIDYFFNMHMETLKKVIFLYSSCILICFISSQLTYYTPCIFSKVNMRAYNWLAKKSRSQWSRSGFRDTCKSDIFVNNHCESFNNAITEFRDIRIITMFKAIHLNCMERIQRRKTRMERRNTVFCNKALEKLKM